MNENSSEPFSGLDRAFHEPKRLAILSSLAARGDDGAFFGDVKDECDLTDGNLNRHLKVLEEAGVIKIRKIDRKGRRPRTEIRLTESGRRHFLDYLDSLERALATAAKSVGRPAKLEGKAGLATRRRAAAR